MAQYSWTLLDDFGKQYKVGLYHGDRSKHVLIHVNRKPVVIDFNINSSKLYSFYIGHEFCEINIKKNEDQFTYSFVVNKEIDTPLNLARKQQTKKYLFYTILLAIVLFGLVIGIGIWILNGLPEDNMG